jgi:hypothetical protein
MDTRRIHTLARNLRQSHQNPEFVSSSSTVLDLMPGNCKCFTSAFYVLNFVPSALHFPNACPCGSAQMARGVA